MKFTDRSSVLHHPSPRKWGPLSRGRSIQAVKVATLYNNERGRLGGSTFAGKKMRFLWSLVNSEAAV